jgi:hypothetical protein
MNPADDSGLRKIGIWLAGAGLLILILTFLVATDDTGCFMRLGTSCVTPSNALYGLIIGMSVLTWAVVLFAAHAVATVLRRIEDRLSKTGVASIDER